MWGDGKLIFESERITKGFLPMIFTVNLENIKVLKIGVESHDGNGSDRRIGLSNVILRKK
jgi:hypothetical protein